MKIISSTVKTVEPTRRIELELPEAKAKELRDFLSSKILWVETPVLHELQKLHEALGGYR